MDNKQGVKLLFHNRLVRLLEIHRREHAILQAASLRLVNWSIYSTYCDCLDLGTHPAVIEATVKNWDVWRKQYT